jgi:hypothetical protein
LVLHCYLFGAAWQAHTGHCSADSDRTTTKCHWQFVAQHRRGRPRRTLRPPWEQPWLASHRSSCDVMLHACHAFRIVYVIPSRSPSAAARTGTAEHNSAKNRQYRESISRIHTTRTLLRLRCPYLCACGQDDTMLHVRRLFGGCRGTLRTRLRVIGGRRAYRHSTRRREHSRALEPGHARDQPCRSADCASMRHIKL